jgi:peptidoglycan hydrolase-like protein with peptidoglycan-binding domain
MKARWMLLLAGLSGLPGIVASAGCSHTRRADDAPVTAEKEEQPEDAAKKRPAEARKKTPPATPRKADAEPESAKDGPPLATGPEGLMTEGSVEKIQDRLRERDLLKGDTSSGRWDEPTRTALRAFQRDNGLPATGTPDDVTLGKLGLKPGDIFRAAKK